MTNNAPEKGSVLGPSARLFTLLASLLYPRKSAPGVFLSRLFGIALLVGLLALRIFDPVFVQTVRNQSFDLYQRIHPREFSKFPVAIADIEIFAGHRRAPTERAGLGVFLFERVRVGLRRLA